MKKRYSNNLTSSLLKQVLLMACAILFSISSEGQSPQKYFDNGMYEQAFVEAAYKQNKKVKLKEKYTAVIYASYEKIYADHLKTISSMETNWLTTYSRFIRLVKFRAKVTHKGVHDNLKNVLYDSEILDHLASKFNKDNDKDLEVANRYEREEKHEKALELYKAIAKRHKEAEPITTLTDRLTIIDHEQKIKDCKQRIGDKYIAEGQRVLEGTEASALAAIDLFEKARSYRPLSFEEEEFLRLAHLVKGESWIKEAKSLMETQTKENARVAYELLEKAKSVRALSAEEEQLSKDAFDLGMTRVMVGMKGGDPMHDPKEMSGILNKSKNSKWITYLHTNDQANTIDFVIEVTENKPNVVRGKVQREVKQSSRTVEYWEEETDNTGNTTNVKKTRQAIGVVAHLTQKKWATISWSIMIKDLSSESVTTSDAQETRIEETHQYASLVSGDALSIPENAQTDVDLNSQPFSSDQEMREQVKSIYLSELQNLVNSQRIDLMH